MNSTSLWIEWLQKWDEMEAQINWPHIRLAGPFFPVGPSSGGQTSGTILMVGKATHRDWYLDSFKRAASRSASERLEERWDCTIDFLNYHKEHQRSFFWHFYRSLRIRTGAEIVWTNLTKIGVARPNDESAPINPFKQFLDYQRELAVKTLLLELNTHQPSLVVLVTGTYAFNEIVQPVFGKWGSWKENKANGRPYLWLPDLNGHPPVLCVAHPDRKARIERDAWLDKAVGLFGEYSRRR